jgi:hypothetical protein
MESKSSAAEIIFLILICLFCGFLAEIPFFFNGGDAYIFYVVNAVPIIVLGLSGYRILTQGKKNIRKIIVASFVFAGCVLYVNLLPFKDDGGPFDLAFIHMPLLLWFFYGMIFSGFDWRNKAKRVEFVRYNGDLAVLTAIILFSGIILTTVTLGLFSVAGIRIETFYMHYVVPLGIVSSPIVSSFIIRRHNDITGKISTIIANIFSPLVLITLIIYLAGLSVSVESPFQNRDFLLMFNIMLLGVMAIIFFSAFEMPSVRKYKFGEVFLLILSVITLAVDAVALIAITGRLAKYGLSANRIAVLGANVTIFVNLILIAVDLFRAVFMKKDISSVKSTIANYFPVYLIWLLFATFALPFLF